MRMILPVCFAFSGSVAEIGLLRDPANLNERNLESKPNGVRQRLLNVWSLEWLVDRDHCSPPNTGRMQESGQSALIGNEVVRKGT